ncbi:MAG: CoA-binding protein [Crocinitomicaceae bacterium]|nr:CoA-binding protein [Crocinitomicaceae bacterium]
MKPTLVIGASANPERYAFKAVQSLVNHGHSVIAFGRRKGVIGDVEIRNDWNTTWKVDTVTLYINSKIQEDYYEMIIGLKPKRVIFNPGTENPTFYNMLKEKDIEVVPACTLVMLSIGDY